MDGIVKLGLRAVIIKDMIGVLRESSIRKLSVDTACRLGSRKSVTLAKPLDTKIAIGKDGGDEVALLIEPRLYQKRGVDNGQIGALLLLLGKPLAEDRQHLPVR